MYWIIEMFSFLESIGSDLRIKLLDPWKVAFFHSQIPADKKICKSFYLAE